MIIPAIPQSAGEVPPDVPGGGGVRLEDVVAITDDGVERLTRHPLEARLLD